MELNLSYGERFRVSTREGVSVVQPAGELDLSSVDRLRECCRAAVEASGPHLVIDLSETSFLDSSALGVFVGVATQLGADGGWLRFAGAQHPAVRKVLDITQVGTSLGNYSTVEDALTGENG